MSINQHVHLVGSIGLENEEQVFKMLAGSVGAKARRYPDGETGARSQWIRWLAAFFASHPSFIRSNADEANASPRFKLANTISAGQLRFDSLGYAAPALQSYKKFSEMKDTGIIPAATRFQVSLPTPIAPVTTFIDKNIQSSVEMAVEDGLRRDLDAIVKAIPADQLAIQWDVAHEIIAHDGGWEIHYDNILQGSVERLARLIGYIPEGVEAGIHLCYGDPGHKHIVEPQDLATCVAFANGICEATARPVHWIHMPVPRDRNDDTYFEPLKDLRLNPETELYLGLVHHTDGVEGTKQRIASAEKVMDNFGIATECGFGRRPPETISELLDIHSTVIDAR